MIFLKYSFSVPIFMAMITPWSVSCFLDMKTLIYGAKTANVETSKASSRDDNGSRLVMQVSTSSKTG